MHAADVKTYPAVVPHSVRIWAQPNRITIKVQASHAECKLSYLEPLNRLNTSRDFDSQMDNGHYISYVDKDDI